jgi:hypothetical protein
MSRKGEQVRDSKPVALSDQTWRDRLEAFSAETLYLTKFQLVAGRWRAELAPKVRKNPKLRKSLIKEKRQRLGEEKTRHGLTPEEKAPPSWRRVGPLPVVGSDGSIQHSVKALDEGGWVL